MEEISSKKMPVQHHHFQTGLCGVAEIYSFLGMLCRNTSEFTFCGSFVDHFLQARSAVLFSPGNKLLGTVKKRLNICEERFRGIAWMS